MLAVFVFTVGSPPAIIAADVDVPPPAVNFRAVPIAPPEVQVVPLNVSVTPEFAGTASCPPISIAALEEAPPIACVRLAVFKFPLVVHVLAIEFLELFLLRIIEYLEHLIEYAALFAFFES